MNKIKKIIYKSHLDKYFKLTSKAFRVAKEAVDKKKEKQASTILDMASRYLDDAKYFKDKGYFVNAFAALNYAHGWLDAGSKLGIFKVKDTQLFVVK